MKFYKDQGGMKNQLVFKVQLRGESKFECRWFFKNSQSDISWSTGLTSNECMPVLKLHVIKLH